ncbi:hypothetical protein J6590_023069 [Homalodisca vitripennis]|nr:hypothetical protein J6590_023069 [Homalodisca vitripennis]
MIVSRSKPNIGIEEFRQVANSMSKTDGSITQHTMSQTERMRLSAACTEARRGEAPRRALSAMTSRAGSNTFTQLTKHARHAGLNSCCRSAGCPPQAYPTRLAVTLRTTPSRCPVRKPGLRNMNLSEMQTCLLYLAECYSSRNITFMID